MALQSRDDGGPGALLCALMQFYQALQVEGSQGAACSVQAHTPLLLHESKADSS